MLWAERGRIGRLALLVNTAGLVVTGDLSWVIFLALNKSLHLLTTGLSGRILLVALTVSAPLILLVTSVFYLWVYARDARPPAEEEGACGVAGG
jgi:hypothetical protein